MHIVTAKGVSLIAYTYASAGKTALAVTER